MERMPLRSPLLLATTALLALGACSSDAVAPPVQPTVLLSVVPQGGATGVDPDTDVVLSFDHPMMPGMEEYVALHQGDVTGPEVAGTCTLSADGMQMTFAPDTPLEPNTTYTVHMGGGMMDEDGDYVDLEDHGPGMGGHWATDEMMGGGGPMGGQMGSHMGDGWQNPDDGTWGMVFTFTTGA
jgi:hypothetical protein